MLVTPARNTARRLLEVMEETAVACRVDPEDDLGLGQFARTSNRLIPEV
ncbi:hypothetical protein RKE30_29405 [Streptomyces sp. Li-HN-5-11]|nr:hypothetical protein [Streptomyces sp. Li-HN-5-11]WNM34195.1 hypothetical protein RKE30_29405 [Streptomyces sp. Li-HN-5-11]